MVNLGQTMNRAAKGRSSKTRPPANRTYGGSWSGRQMRAMGAAHARMLNPRAAAMAGLTL